MCWGIASLTWWNGHDRGNAGGGAAPTTIADGQSKLARGAISALTRVQLVLASLRRRPGKQDLRLK